MSDTYNENEIVRCKHLNEFARQLRIKLDGGTDGTQARTGNFQALVYADGTSSSTVINDLDEFYVDINRLVSAKGNTRWILQISYGGNAAERGTRPFPAYIESSAEDFNPNFAFSWGSSDSINFGASISVALYKKIARDINLTFVIPESNGFAELRKSWTIHFINPT